MSCFLDKVIRINIHQRILREVTHFIQVGYFDFRCRYLVSVSVNFTQFGATVVYVLLASENIVKLLPENSSFNCCYMAIIVAVVMTPFTWLGTPKDFWYVHSLNGFRQNNKTLVILSFIHQYTVQPMMLLQKPSEHF